MKHAFLCLIGLLGIAAQGHPQVTHIDAGPVGRAVVVSGDYVLLHTAQLLPTDDAGKLASENDVTGQALQVFVNLRYALQQHKCNLTDVVKLNFYVARPELLSVIQRQLAINFPKERPAVSYVVTRLPLARAQVGLDAVALMPRPREQGKGEEPRLKNRPALPGFLPPGTRIFVSGQAEKGEDLAQATRKTMDSLAATLKFLKRGWPDVVQLKAFVQPMAQADVARREMAAFFKDLPIPPIVLVEWHSSVFPIEIELIAWGGPERAGEPLEFLTPPGMTASKVYSRVARVNYGNLIYIDGLYAGKPGMPAEEITDVFSSLKKLTEKAGSDLHHLAKATYYVTDPETTKKMGELRPNYYDPKRPPSASLAQVAGTGKKGHHLTLDMIAVPAPEVKPNDYGPVEYGHGLDGEAALDGWLSLFDGKNTFGWTGATIEGGRLSGGETSGVFKEFELKAMVAAPGTLMVGDERIQAKAGALAMSFQGPGRIRLANGLAVSLIQLRPKALQPLFNGKDLTGWKPINHPTLPKETWPSWNVEKGALHVRGGPGALEYQEKQFGDFVLQLQAKTLWRYSNGGLFFRSIPGDFMNGYEAQVYHRCLYGDPGQPFFWATGAIDDRQNARRLVSRDGETFLMTVIAVGPHLRTWVNGYQTVDWIDTRPKHTNPRQGLRLEPGTIQLQAHDVGTNFLLQKLVARDW